MGYNFRVFETVKSKAENTALIPITPGRYLICTDTSDVYYDTKDNVRKHLTDIIDLETDAERTAILAPLDKFYFVKDTAHIWKRRKRRCLCNSGRRWMGKRQTEYFDQWIRCKSEWNYQHYTRHFSTSDGGSKEWRALCLRSGRWNYHNRCGWHCTHLRYSNRHYFAELRKAVLTDERNN